MLDAFDLLDLQSKYRYCMVRKVIIRPPFPHLSVYPYTKPALIFSYILLIIVEYIFLVNILCFYFYLHIILLYIKNN